MERKVRLATAVSGVSERPELAPSDRFRYGVLIGYARVSTGEQTTAAQVAALKTSGTPTALVRPPSAAP